MSYSLEESEWRPVCQCEYEEVHDTVERGNCEIHCGMGEEELLKADPPERRPAARKPAAPEQRRKEDAA